MNGTSVSQEQLVSQIVESRQRYNTKRNEWIQMMNESESNGDIAFAIQAGVEVVNLERLYGHGDKARTMVDRVCGLIKGCLLYTSPSPRDRTRSRMPSSA